jgi:hypothetical protein
MLALAGQLDMSIKVQILYSDGCEHTPPTVSQVRSIAEEMGVNIDLEMVLVENEAQAKGLNFFGSPTVRVNGRDIDPNARSNGIAGLS